MEENEEVEAKTGTLQLPQIPEEIVLRILSKLPVKSLLRFRCVSNRWRFLISDPSFTLSTPRHQIVVMPRINWTVSPFHMIDDEGSVVEIPKPNPLMSRFCCLSIEGSCNGLLLLGAQGDFFLWNPSTGSCSQVLSRQWSSSYNWTTNLWLCYDSSADEYKAFGVFYDFYVDDYRGIVVSLSPYDANDGVRIVGSCNKEEWIEIRFPYSKERVKSGPTVNGRLHMLVTDSIDEEDAEYLRPNLIVCLDPRRNEILKVPMPEHDEKRESILVLGLRVLDGCLSLVLWRNDHIQSREVEVLAMKKYGDKSSWTRLFIISDVIHLHPSVYVAPLCITRNGVVLLSVDDTILAFNPMENSHWNPIGSNCVGAAMFVESLASPMVR